MATWSDVSDEAYQAAQRLRIAGLYRSSVSRAYYAAFATATARLKAANVKFPEGRWAPNHETLPVLVLGNLGMYPVEQRRELKTLLDRLYKSRIGADYHPHMVYGRRDAVKAPQQVNVLRSRLGSQP